MGSLWAVSGTQQSLQKIDPATNSVVATTPLGREPGFLAAGEGSILVTGSMASKRGMALNPAYVASKHGVLGLARAIAVELAPSGVRCNCIIPGFIETPAFDLIPPEQAAKINERIPQRRMGSAEELAQTACFLLSPAASHVTGQDWAVDGGVLNTLEV